MKDFLNILENGIWVWSQLKHSHKTTLSFVTLLIIVGSLITSYIPRLTGKMVDVIYNNESAYGLIFTIGLLGLFCLALEVVRRYWIENVATKMQKDFLVKSFAHIIQLDLHWLHGQRVGGINGKIQRAVEGSVKLMKLCTMDFLPNCFQILFAIIVGIVTNYYAGLILLLVSFIGICIVIKQIQSQKGVRLALLRARENNDANTVELLSGIESVRVANEEQKQIGRVESINENLRTQEMKHHCYMLFFDSLKSFNIIFWNICILLIGIYLATLGFISAGEIVVFTMLFNNVVNPLQQIHKFIDQAHEASLKTDDLLDILSKEKDFTFQLSNIPQVALDKTYNEAIRIQGLSHSYNNNRILDNISYTFNKGKYYGIIGNTGCGKTTFLKFLMRLMDAGDNIHLYNKSINSISKSTLASLITFMPQTPFLLNASIKDNLLFGCMKNIPDNELWWALEQVCLTDFVKSLEQGLDYMLNERASNLSGGQKQRIALARVFLALKCYNSSQIVILDEATSALDVDTERIVIGNLLRLKSSNTTIISIAHRLSTLEKTDIILEFCNGKLYRELSYEELMNYKQRCS